jgi:hypothetical protein
MMQLSKITASLMIGKEVSKPVSIMTRDFGSGSACAGSSIPVVNTEIRRSKNVLLRIITRLLNVV